MLLASEKIVGWTGGVVEKSEAWKRPVKGQNELSEVRNSPPKINDIWKVEEASVILNE